MRTGMPMKNLSADSCKREKKSMSRVVESTGKWSEKSSKRVVESYGECEMDDCDEDIYSGMQMENMNMPNTAVAANIQPSSPLPATKTNPDLLIAKQNSDTGEFAYDAKLLAEICAGYQTVKKDLGLDDVTLMTLVAAVWLKKYYNTSKYNLITNKAFAFLKKQKNINYKDVESQVSAHL